MTSSTRLIFSFFALLLGAGCAVKGPVSKPVVVAPVPVSPVQGTWQSLQRDGKLLKMVFNPDGTLRFEGIAYFNPARWSYDASRHELNLLLPAASDENLQIFKMYVGDGVKSFDRPGKKVTYHFDNTTDTLNVAGWPFTPVGANEVHTAPEPTLR